jgi:drug/metabolite transporter (DMT)-like permease
VAVFLGWTLASEPVTARTLLSAAVIIAGVVIITTARARDRAHRRRDEPEPLLEAGAASAGADGVAGASGSPQR